jgi:protocatechuate 3,4-dioxygenase beta subunit
VTDIERQPATPLKTRRAMLGLLGGAGATLIAAACGGSDGQRSAKQRSSATTSTTAAGSTAALTVTDEIPEETAGPFPGDGTNGPNILTEDGVVRSDIRSSIGGATGLAAGVPLTIALTLVDASDGGRPLPGTAVYLWHCDRDGQYSMYSGLTEENYLRGVQAADASGQVTFRSIFPAAYSGRWPHIHFEMFEDLGAATNGSNAIAVSQLAFPADVSNAVYATDGYEQSVRNMAGVSLDGDMVFRDGVSLQTPTVTGDVTNGYTATLTVGV